MINKAILVGNIGKDPEVKTLENGTKVATFSLATSESYKDKNDAWQTLTEWHNIVAWRNLADRAEKLTKGTMVYIEGKITHRKYNDKDGVERMITDIVASTIVSTVKSSSSSSSSDAPPPPMEGPIPF
jgi:single-strand DNA-binding protein